MAGFTLPEYRYYPLPIYNSGSPRERPIYGNSGTLNQASSFETFGNRFVPSYPVNASPTTDRTNDDFFFSATAGQGSREANGLNQTPISQARDFDTPLAFNSQVSGSKTGSTPGAGFQVTTTPTTAPDSPEKWADFIKSFETSDYNMAELLAQPSFQIRNVGNGLKVTTDGAGNIDNVRIDLSYQGVNLNQSTLDPTYFLTNREEILLRASLNSPAGKIAQDNELNLRVGKSETNNNQFINDLSPLQSLFRANRVSQNPILDRLIALQPKDNGLNVVGFDTNLDLQASQKLAASQARLNVQQSEGFQNNITQLTQPQLASAAEPQAPIALPQEVAAQLDQLFASRQLDGKIPLVASLPATDAIKKSLSVSASSTAPNAVEDALSKKSGAPNPFLYFGSSLLHSQQSGGEAQTGFGQQGQRQPEFAFGANTGGAGSGSSNGNNPFGSRSNSQFGFGGGAQSGQGEGQPGLYTTPRKPLAYVA